MNPKCDAGSANHKLPVVGAPLMGRVLAAADARNRLIKEGDLLITPGVPGGAMKVANHAQAQGTLPGNTMRSLEEGRHMELLRVSLQ